MEKEAIKKYKKAGKIASEARSLAESIFEPGLEALDFVNQIENFIQESGAKFAFPVNFSVNSDAAHDTPDTNEKYVIQEDDLIKVDIGVHVDGYVADTAISLYKNKKHENIVNSVKEALDAAIKKVKPGAAVSDISETIENKIHDNDFTPIVNLTGHTIERYNVHAGVEIPNVKTDTQHVLEEGDVLAIEPFATDGSGKVKESNSSFIFRIVQNKSVRNRFARKLMKKSEDFEGFPFCQRWADIPPMQFNMAIKELKERGIIQAYPVLKEMVGGQVAQAEHTVIVMEDPIVTTL